MVSHVVKGAALVVVGLAIASFAVLGPIGTYQAVQNHETTTGTVLSVDMESATEVDDGETETEYYPRIEYEYEVDGERYESKQVFHPSQVENEPGELRGKEFDTRRKAENVVDRFPNGATVTITYDPGAPANSYLVDPSTDLLTSAAIMGLFGLLFSGVGIAGALGRISLSSD